MNLSPHFTLAEMTFTQIRGHDNMPTWDEAENLKYLCKHVLEPVRKQFGPLIITSGYRSVDVNLAVGGTPKSWHTKGLAADFVPRESVPLYDIVEWIVKQPELPFQECIYELGRWVHLATRPGGHGCERKSLMTFVPGKFESWNPQDRRVTR